MSEKPPNKTADANLDLQNWLERKALIADVKKSGHDPWSSSFSDAFFCDELGEGPITENFHKMASAILKEHGYRSWQDVKTGDPEHLQAAANVLYYFDLLLDDLIGHRVGNAIARALKCGFCAGGLPGTEKLRAKLSRTNKPVVDRIRVLRKDGMSDGQIAMQLNVEGFRTRNGTEFKKGNISSYRRTHSID